MKSTCWDSSLSGSSHRAGQRGPAPQPLHAGGQTAQGNSLPFVTTHVGE